MNNHFLIAIENLVCINKHSIFWGFKSTKLSPWKWNS